MGEPKKNMLYACDLAMKLIQVLEDINHEDFVDRLAASVHYNDKYEVIDVKNKVIAGEY